MVTFNHFSSLAKNKQTSLLQMEALDWGALGPPNWEIDHCETMMNEWIAANRSVLEGSNSDYSLTVLSIWAYCEGVNVPRKFNPHEMLAFLFLSD